MHCIRVIHRSRREASRLTVMAGLLGFIVLNLGLPLVQPPQDKREKDRSTPFPCQNRPCGCMSARDCFRSCCCFSARERLAWAAAHKVEAPAELVAAAASEQDTCDEHEHAEHCCTKPSASSTATHGCHDHESAQRTSDEPVASEQGWKLVFVVGALAGQCRGIGPSSGVTFSALPLADAVSYRFDWCPVGWISIKHHGASSPSLEPPSRPPCA
jgi:hypothetical protein